MEYNGEALRYLFAGRQQGFNLIIERRNADWINTRKLALVFRALTE